MRVYVDELPKSCGDCVFCKQTEYCYYCDKLHMKLGYIDKDKDCPLQPLADYTKQVRKELCEEIREEVKKSLRKYRFFHNRLFKAFPDIPEYNYNISKIREYINSKSKNNKK